MIFIFSDVLLTGASYRDSACTAKRSSRVCRKIRITDVCMVVCASGVQCNSTRSWVECSHQRSSLDPGSTWVGTA